MVREVKIIAGTASKRLGDRIIEQFKRKEIIDQESDSALYQLSPIEVKKFANDNTFVKLSESVREADVFLIQSSGTPVNDRLMELLITIDACRRSSAGRINAIVPYFPYARSDKIDQPRVALTARLVADLIQAAGADRVISMDLHVDQIQGFFHLAFDHLKATSILASYVEKNFLHGLSHDERRQEWVVVSPDAGAAKRAQTFATSLDLELAVILKQRSGNNDQSELMHVIGNVAGRKCIIIDDEIATGGSLVNAINSLCENFGAKEAIAVATHGIFANRAVRLIEEAHNLKAVVVTDTLDVPQIDTMHHMSYLSGGVMVNDEILVTKIHECSVAELFAATIRAVHMGESVTDIYERWNIARDKKNDYTDET